MKKNLLLLVYFLIPILIFSQKTGFSLEKEFLWTVQVLHDKVGGELSFYATVEKIDSLIIIKSFEDRDKFLIGNSKAMQLRNFRERKYKKSLFAFEINGENGQIHSVVGTPLLKNIIINDDSIVGQVGERGQFSCKKTNITKNECNRMNDYYVTLSENIINTTSANIYNPKLVTKRNWKNFCKNLRDKSSKIYDDLELYLLFYAYTINFDFSHFSLIKEKVDFDTPSLDSRIKAVQLNDTTVVFSVLSFNSKIAEIDSLFARYHNYKIKVLDLRNTPGGNFKPTFYFASHLTKDTIAAGAFITRDCLDCGKNTEKLYPLQKNEIDDFSRLLDEKKGLKITLYPSHQNEEKDDDIIYVLTSKRTASACEPLVYGLKKMPNVKIIGENTAGKMLSTSVFNIGNGFYLIVPTADYITNDGKTLENRGVSPSIKVKSEKALDYVLEQLNRKK